MEEMIEGEPLLNLLNREAGEKYVLKLFITGASQISMRAINNLKTILDTYLENNYDLEIIDVHQQPLMARDEDITAIPMLIKKYPFPLRRLVGDMSNSEKVMKGLGLL